jgi:hypothetical protein
VHRPIDVHAPGTPESHYFGRWRLRNGLIHNFRDFQKQGFLGMIILVNAISKEKIIGITRKKAIDNVYKIHRVTVDGGRMSNTQDATTIRTTSRRACGRRFSGVNQLLQGVVFALAFSFTAALVLGFVG